MTDKEYPFFRAFLQQAEDLAMVRVRCEIFAEDDRCAAENFAGEGGGLPGAEDGTRDDDGGSKVVGKQDLRGGAGHRFSERREFTKRVVRMTPGFAMAEEEQFHRNGLEDFADA